MGLNLNLGCGRNPLAGWVNVDIAPMPGVDVVADLDACRTQPLPFADDSASTLQMLHVLEHIRDTLALMQELHRIALPGALLTIRCPYGSSDDAAEDPTHRQLFYVNSFSFFGQPAYWRADYGYRGDWIIETVTLNVARAENANLTGDQIGLRVLHLRNIVQEMVVVLKAVKPIRPADPELRHAPAVNLQLV